MKNVTGNSFVESSFQDLLRLRALVHRERLKQANVTGKTGETPSLFKTKGMDFSEVRSYQAGDDIRQIDWRVTAKYGKPFTKLYVEEKEQRVFFLLDLRSVMQFATSGQFKSVIVARLFSYLSWKFLAKKLQINGVLLTNDTVNFFADIKTAAELSALLKKVSEATTLNDGKINTELKQGAQKIISKLTHGSLVFVLSNLMDLNADFIKKWRTCTRRNSVFLMPIIDKLEKELPTGVLPFLHGNEVFVLNTHAQSVRKSFSDSFQKQVDIIQKDARKNNMYYLPVETNEDYIKKVKMALQLQGQA